MRGALPKDASGKSCPYPLGVQNLDFGYRALVKSDVPWLSDAREWVICAWPPVPLALASAAPIRQGGCG